MSTGLKTARTPHDLPYDEDRDDVIWGGVCEESLSVLAGYIGPHKIMWAADPHSDGFFPGCRRRSAYGSSRVPQAKHQILAEGAIRF